jgi:hypothetical protein
MLKQTMMMMIALIMMNFKGIGGGEIVKNKMMKI